MKEHMESIYIYVDSLLKSKLYLFLIKKKVSFFLSLDKIITISI